ncbi:ABC transporter permease [Paenibacillus sp. sgz500958]|uniref:ABC transporter permease n=1 Tax=Paenibacillus sp. sgz500958 TaxID=3242475 RepID=UPI0036D3749E
MHKFTRLVQNEWLKISKKRMFLVPYILLVLMPLVIGYIIYSLSADSFPGANDFTATLMLPIALGKAVTMIAIIGTAGSVAKEHSQGTIKFLLIRARSRTMILASKYVAVLLYAISLTFISVLASYASGVLWFGASGGEAGLTDIMQSIVYGFVYTLVYVTLTFMIGILTTSTGVTIGISMFAIAIDNLVITKNFYKYFLFPNLNLSAYQNDSPPLPGMTLSFSIVMLAIYMTVFLIAGFVVFKRRDVA